MLRVPLLYGAVETLVREGVGFCLRALTWALPRTRASSRRCCATLWQRIQVCWLVFGCVSHGARAVSYDNVQIRYPTLVDDVAYVIVKLAERKVVGCPALPSLFAERVACTRRWNTVG